MTNNVKIRCSVSCINQDTKENKRLKEHDIKSYKYGMLFNIKSGLSEIELDKIKNALDKEFTRICKIGGLL